MATSTSIRLPPSLLGEPTWGDWTVIDPLGKLQTKYATVASRAFDGYAARRAREDPTWLDRVEATDLAMTHFMNSRLAVGDVEALLAPETRSALERALAEVPHDWDLRDDFSEERRHRLRGLLGSFPKKGFGYGKVTKILCQKRPHLIPMLDGLVMSALFKRAWPKSAGEYAEATMAGIEAFRELLHMNRSAVETIADEINGWLATRDGPEGPVTLGCVRVLDNLIWFDFGGYSNFSPEWKLVDGEVRRGA